MKKLILYLFLIQVIVYIMGVLIGYIWSEENTYIIDEDEILVCKRWVEINSYIVYRILPIIAQAESSNGMYLHGDKNHSLGKYQISLKVLADYNKTFQTNYTKNWLLVNENNKKVAIWHIRRIINALIKHNLCVCKAHICYLYNSGLSNINKPIPKTHKNLIYKKIFQEYYKNK